MAINKNNLAVFAFASNEKPSRDSLANVCFTPTETMATNSHYLVRVSNPPSETVQTTTRAFLIPAEQLKPIRVKNGDAIELSSNGTGHTWSLTTGTSTFHLEETTDARFPNVDAIMPKEQPGLTIGFNPDYLAKLAKAFSTFSDADKPMVTLSFYGPDKAAKLTAKNSDGQTMTALLNALPFEVSVLRVPIRCAVCHLAGVSPR